MDQQNKFPIARLTKELDLYRANEKRAAEAVFQALIEQAVVRQLPPLELMEHVRMLALEKWGTG